MARRPTVRMRDVRLRWERSPFQGGILGIASVALATLGVGIACTVIALIVTFIY